MILILESKYIDSTGPVLSIYFDSNIKIITVLPVHMCIFNVILPGYVTLAL